MTMPISRALDVAGGHLAAAGIENARREARLLLAHVLGMAPLDLLAANGRQLGEEAASALDDLVARRAARWPLAQLIGRREFWSLDIAVGPQTLIPRPDSETVIDAALVAIPDRDAPLRVLDLGTGTGCLLLALLSELPNAEGVGIDLCPVACAVARHNLDSLGMSGRAWIVNGDWAAPLAARFDLIVANPPYIPSADLAGLMPEVRDHEPRLALDGGNDGLAAYRRIVPMLAGVLADSGRVVVEISEGQDRPVAALFAAADFEKIDFHADLAGRRRCVSATGLRG